MPGKPSWKASWGLVSAATALVQGSGGLYAVRVLLGIAEAGFYPGVLLYLMLWFPTRYRGRMLAFFVLGGSLSGVFGNPLTGLILDHTDGFLGLSGWRMMFVLEGLPAIVIGMVAFFVLRDHPADAAWLGERERTWLTGELSAERSGVHGHNAQAGSFRMIKDIRVAMLSAIYFCKSVGQYGLTFFMPQMIVLFEANAHHTYSPTEVSLLTSIPHSPPCWWPGHLPHGGVPVPAHPRPPPLRGGSARTGGRRVPPAVRTRLRNRTRRREDRQRTDLATGVADGPRGPGRGTARGPACGTTSSPSGRRATPGCTSCAARCDRRYPGPVPTDAARLRVTRGVA
ncbi:MFS transporter [Streptomyces sp. TS71-3]|uniref:MFS transporter n=1 Tax=Streptomyces sp. TS71-3 TaxID=2733862 RepID=UPI001BB3F738|nr:MFS transporter [Streptomyces sp. TS71-3]